ncbi:MAG: MYXO-CTERM sorting domain-containing protein [Sorangiineae bacterium]|nr:MYXO-CTERM sorting domain-containing protein [Sorangiineae bacterium]
MIVSSHGVCGAASDALQTRPCEPYACGPTACKDKCATDDDCTNGYECNVESGKCLNGASCDGDHTITAPGQAPTDCRPYRCQAGGTCMTTCVSIDDCVDGFICDTDGRCATATFVRSEDDSAGGCGCRTASSGGGSAGWLGAGLLAAGALVRRRRRVARRSAM